jgi:hypothetical protein
LVKLDLNNPDFQQEWLYKLEQEQAEALRRQLGRIIKYEWDQLYNVSSLKWEKIESKTTSKGNNVYTFRFSDKYRATGYRDGEYLVVMNLHPDHNSAYRKKLKNPLKIN